MEYCFCNSGVVESNGFVSHRRFEQMVVTDRGPAMVKGPFSVTDLGITSISGPDMLKALNPWFGSGSYDILLKNCNSFSDVALFYLLGARLDGKYLSLEQIGTSAEKYLRIVTVLSRGTYRPNPKADGFDQ